MTQTYLQVMPSLAFIFNGCWCVLRNDGNPRMAMLSTVIGSLSNIVLDYVFILPWAWACLAPFATGLAGVKYSGSLPHWFRRAGAFMPAAAERRHGRTIVWLGLPAYLAQLPLVW